MNSDPEKLIEMFSGCNAAYLITGSDALPQLRAELDGDEGEPTRIGVARLPTGQAGQVSPFLTVNGYLFSAAAGEEQTQMALEFAKFATSGEGQGHLMQTASRAPANVLALTLVDDSALNVIVEQARTSVLLPSRPENLVLKEGGEILYQSVLEDERSPSEAMVDFYTFLSETPQSAIIAYAGEMVLVCEGDGRLLLWHSWPFAATTAEPKEIDDDQQISPANALERIIFEFNELCPDVTVDTEFVPAEALPARLEMASAEGVAPDLFLAPHDLIVPLAKSEAIKPITSLVDQAFLDQHLDKSVEALHYGEDLYGVPQTLDVAALYYNTGVVSSTVSTLDELFNTATPYVQIAIDTSFDNAHWGIGDFRGTLFDAQGKPLTDQSGFLEWLGWLKDAQERPGMVLDSDQDDLQQRFADGEFAYLVAGPDALTPLRESLGEQVRVVLLPAGRIGQPSPLLAVDSFLFSATASEEQTDLALKFAQFAASETNQMLLAQEANLIPTNRSAADSIEDPAISIFARQAADTAVLLPPDIPAEVLEAGERVYTLVLGDGLKPELAVVELTRFAGRD
jgi:maltose-binding protein MalE